MSNRSDMMWYQVIHIDSLKIRKHQGALPKAKKTQHVRLVMKTARGTWPTTRCWRCFGSHCAQHWKKHSGNRIPLRYKNHRHVVDLQVPCLIKDCNRTSSDRNHHLFKHVEWSLALTDGWVGRESYLHMSGPNCDLIRSIHAIFSACTFMTWFIHSKLICIVIELRWIKAHLWPVAWQCFSRSFSLIFLQKLCSASSDISLDIYTYLYYT